jgi:hypothetical protein
MNWFLMMCFILSILFGLVDGGKKMDAVKKHPELGVKQSRNIWTFLFYDKY